MVGVPRENLQLGLLYLLTREYGIGLISRSAMLAPEVESGGISSALARGALQIDRPAPSLLAPGPGACSSGRRLTEPVSVTDERVK